MNLSSIPGLPDPTIAAKGYAHPERLVSTDWLAAHLEHPALRLLECNEDVLLYGVEHIPGAQKIDWHIDLNDPVERDYVDQAAFQQLLRARGHRRIDDRGVLRRQEQLVGHLRVLGVPPVRLRERGRCSTAAARSGSPRAAPPPPTCRRFAASAYVAPTRDDDADPRLLRRRAAHQQAGRPHDRRALAAGVHRRAAAHARLSAGRHPARRAHPRRAQCAVGTRRRRRRLLQDRRRSARDLRGRSGAQARRRTW